MTDPLLIDLPTSIETARLLLRPPRAGDGQALLPALTESLAQLRRFLSALPWVAADPTPDSAERFCRNAHANFLARKDLPFFVFEQSSGQLLGAAGLHRTVWTTPKTEVGYWGRTSRAGHGFIAEAVDAVTAYAFEHLGAVRVEAIVDEDNHASRRLAERCGYRLEGVLRDERRAPEGDLRNTCVYARFPEGDRRAAPAVEK